MIVSGTIRGITADLLANLAETHCKSIRPFCTDGNLEIRRTQASPGMAAGSIVLEVRNPSQADETAEDAWSKNPTGINNAIKALLPEPIEIGAMEDASEDVGRSRAGSTIGKLISEIMEPIEQQHGADIRKALDGIRQRLGAEGTARAPELDKFDEGANKSLEDIFAGMKIRLHVPTPDIKTLFKDGTVRVFEEGETVGREIGMVGHGAQRSIQMALVRYLAELRGSADSDKTSTTLLLVDEPELYLHPQAIEQVRLALKTLSGQGYQVVFATHSPLMIDRDDIGSTLIIRKTAGGGTHARKRLSEAVAETIQDAPSQSRVLFELGNASKILFSDHVLIAEGRTEQILVPEIFHQVKGYTLGSKRIALVDLGGSGNTAKGLLVLQAIGIPARALVDLDYAFRGAEQAGLLAENDEDVVECRRICSDVSGQCKFVLAQDGFPERNEVMSASDAFALLATLKQARQPISRLHDKLKEKNIWLWKKGAIEDHLGIDAKGESAWAKCVQDIQQQGCEKTIKDYPGLVALLDWIEAEEIAS